MTGANAASSRTLTVVGDPPPLATSAFRNGSVLVCPTHPAAAIADVVRAESSMLRSSAGAALTASSDRGCYAGPVGRRAKSVFHQLLLPGVWETVGLVLGRPASPVGRTAATTAGTTLSRMRKTLLKSMKLTAGDATRPMRPWATSTLRRSIGYTRSMSSSRIVYSPSTLAPSLGAYPSRVMPADVLPKGPGHIRVKRRLYAQLP
jgi:hypothetical protein